MVAKNHHAVVTGMAKIFLVMSIVFFGAYALFPLFGGILSISALLHWGSMAVLCTAVMNMSRHGDTLFGVTILDYAVVCVCSVVNVIIWFSYPASIVVSVIVVLSLRGSYRSYRTE